MLKKSVRLGRTAFSNYFSKGKRSHNPYSTIIYSKEEVFLCSVVVGKKVSKKAPVRNSLRRRVYALVGKVIKDQNSTGACIVILKPVVINLSRKAFLEVMTKEIGSVLN